MESAKRNILAASPQGSSGGWTRLRHLAEVMPSNVDKVVVEGEVPVRLCNYVDVYKNNVIHAGLELAKGSATAREIEKFGLKAGDVIITKDSEDPSDIAVPALVRDDLDGVVCGYHLAILRPNPRRAHGPFLFWALLAKPIRDAFSINATGITRFGLTVENIKSVRIPAADPATQNAIAAFLDAETARIDDTIERVGGQAAAQSATSGSFLSRLLEKRSALITAAVTGQIDPAEWRRRGEGDRRLDAIAAEITG